MTRAEHLKKKREEALARQTACNKLSPQQQLDKLDKKLGKDIGATKERARLHKLIKGGSK